MGILPKWRTRIGHRGGDHSAPRRPCVTGVYRSVNPQRWLQRGWGCHASIAYDEQWSTFVRSSHVEPEFCLQRIVLSFADAGISSTVLPQGTAIGASRRKAAH